MPLVFRLGLRLRMPTHVFNHVYCLQPSATDNPWPDRLWATTRWTECVQKMIQSSDFPEGRQHSRWGTETNGASERHREWAHHLLRQRDWTTSTLKHQPPHNQANASDYLDSAAILQVGKLTGKTKISRSDTVTTPAWTSARCVSVTFNGTQRWR